MRFIVILLAAALPLVTGCSAEPDAELSEVVDSEELAPSVETAETKTTPKGDAGAQQGYLVWKLNDLLVSSY